MKITASAQLNPRKSGRPGTPAVVLASGIQLAACRLGTPWARVETWVAYVQPFDGLRGPVRVARRREAEQQELAHGGLLDEWLPVRVERVVSPGVAASPEVIGVPVADMGAVAADRGAVISVPRWKVSVL